MQSALLPAIPVKHRLLITAFTCAILLGYILLSPAQNPDIQQAYSSFLQIVPSFFGGIYTVLHHTQRQEPLAMQRRGWTCMGVASLLFGVGQIIWTYDESYLKIPVPFPSVADGFFLACPLMLIIGTLLLFGQMRPAGRARLVLDSAIGASSFAVLLWYILVGRVFTFSHDPDFSKILGVIYPILDAIVLCAALLLLTRVRRDLALRIRVACLCAGLFALTGADTAYNILTLDNSFKPGDWPDVAWTTGWIFIWYASLPFDRLTSQSQVEMREDELLGEPEQPLYNAIQIALPYLAVIASFIAVIAIDFTRSQGKISAAVYGIGWVLLVLVIVRQVFTLLENQHTLRENRELTAVLRSFNDNLESRVRQRTEQLTALHRLARAVNDSLEVEAVLEAAIRHLPSAIPGAGFIIHIFGDDKEHLDRSSLHRERGIIPEEALRLVDGPLLEAADTLALPASVSQDTHCHYLRAPLCWQHFIRGVVIVVRQGTHFDANECELLEGIGLTIGTAIENARQYTAALQAEQNIKTSLTEKEVLLKEVHHRVKNNMQVISSLLNMQASYSDDPRVVAMFHDSQNRIRSMALVHERLYQAADLAHINFNEYLGDITANLMRSYRGGEVRLVTKIDDVQLDIDTAIPCGLIVNELVSNALKHAFPRNDGSQRARDAFVSVRLRINDTGNIELAVCDNGIGFPQDIDYRQTDSLGLQLVTTLVLQVGGTLDLAGNPDSSSGTLWVVALPRKTVKAPET